MIQAYTLLEDYLFLLNCAMDSQVGSLNAFSADFLTKIKQILHGKRIGIAIFQRTPHEPDEYFTICLIDGCFQILAHGITSAVSVVRLPRGYLEDIVANPDQYTPFRLNQVWESVADEIGT